MMQGIFAYGGTNNRRTLLSVVVLFVASVLLVMPYYFVYRAVTVLLDGGAFSPAFIAEHALIIGGLMIVQTVLYTKGLDLSHQAAYGTLMNLRLSLAEKLEKLPLGVTQQKGVGALKKIFTDDIDSFEVLLAHALPEGVANALSTLLVLTAIFVCDWRLGLLVLAVIVLGMVPVMLMGSIGNKGAADYYNASRHMNNTIIEYVNGMEVVKVFNKTGESYARFTNAVNDYRDYTLRWYRACWPWMAAYTSILPCTLLFVLPVGAVMVMKNWVALPDFVLAICLALALGMPLLRTMSFVSVMPQIRYKLAELERVLDHQPLIEGRICETAKQVDVVFDHVDFSYEDGTEILHDVSLELAPGTKTAIVGESGAGKSTLAKLLVHYYDVSGGAVRIGGRDLRDLSLAGLNALVSYVSQDNFLFNRSLADNIRLGRPEATDEEVLRAAEAAQCMDFIDALPEGIHTLAGDCGNRLSGGERQRITLARALLADAPVLVLDEATAFSDAEHERRIEAVLNQSCGDKTRLVIAHRLQTICDADQICVLDGGRIQDIGTHEELLGRCAIYKRLWQANEESDVWQIEGSDEP